MQEGYRPIAGRARTLVVLLWICGALGIVGALLAVAQVVIFRDPAAFENPETPLQKVVSTKWAEKGGSAVDLVKAFQWTNDDQNVVAKYIAVDKMTPEVAAKKWVEANRDKVDAWLK